MFLWRSLTATAIASAAAALTQGKPASNAPESASPLASTVKVSTGLPRPGIAKN